MEQRIDLLTSALCEEIDYWKEQATLWKNEYIKERDLNIQVTNERLSDAQKGVANALMFCLSVKDNPDGSLSINKEDRKLLAETIN